MLLIAATTGYKSSRNVELTDYREARACPSAEKLDWLSVRSMVSNFNFNNISSNIVNF